MIEQQDKYFKNELGRHKLGGEGLSVPVRVGRMTATAGWRRLQTHCWLISSLVLFQSLADYIQIKNYPASELIK